MRFITVSNDPLTLLNIASNPDFGAMCTITATDLDSFCVSLSVERGINSLSENYTAPTMDTAISTARDSMNNLTSRIQLLEAK